MISLAWPWMLLLLPLPWLVRRWLPPARAEVDALRVPFAVAEAGHSGTHGAPGRRWSALLVWGLLVLAIARPVGPGPVVDTPMTGRDLMVALDISVSMATRDMGPEGAARSRLDAALELLDRFIAGRRGDRVGLMVFGGRPYVLVPLTHDHDGLRGILDDVDVGLAGATTALGATLALASARTQQLAAERRVLVLITDGADTAPGIPVEMAARRAARAGLRVYTIGVGAADEAVDSPWPIDPLRDLDEPRLRAIAEQTGGRYFRATDPGAMTDVFSTIDRLESTTVTGAWLQRPREYYAWPLGTALLLSIATAIAHLVRQRPAEDAHDA